MLARFCIIIKFIKQNWEAVDTKLKLPMTCKLGHTYWIKRKLCNTIWRLGKLFKLLVCCSTYSTPFFMLLTLHYHSNLSKSLRSATMLVCIRFSQHTYNSVEFILLQWDNQLVWKIICITLASWRICRFLHEWSYFVMPTYHGLGRDVEAHATHFALPMLHKTTKSSSSQDGQTTFTHTC